MTPDHGIPGTAVAHLPAKDDCFVGSPSIAKLGDGEYVVSHDIFGPGSTFSRTVVFRTGDRGATWSRLAVVDGQFWSTLFVHDDALYLLGTSERHGSIVIRRSRDGGASWTVPKDAASGLLRSGRYHCAPTPVVAHDGRLWRAFEDFEGHGGGQWGRSFRAGMLSVAADADLLDGTRWVSTNFLESDPAWFDGECKGWLEGNAVVGPDGSLLDLLRVDYGNGPRTKSAIVSVDSSGTRADFDTGSGFVDMPGGVTKFTVRHDPMSGLYWSLVNDVPDPEGTTTGLRARNTVALAWSKDLRDWRVARYLLTHPDDLRHAFQYVDWIIDGDDIVYVSRTAFDDSEGGAPNFHDSNYVTFHVVEDFRRF